MATRIPGGPKPPVTPIDKKDSTESTKPKAETPKRPSLPPPPADLLETTTPPKKSSSSPSVTPPAPDAGETTSAPAGPSTPPKVSPEVKNLDTESFLLSNLSLDKSDATGPSFEMSPTAPAAEAGVEISAEPTAAMRISEGETFGDPFDSRWEIIHPTGLAGLTPRSPDEAFDGPPLKGNPVRLRFRVKEPAPGRTFNVRVPGPELSLRDAMKAQCKNAAKVMFLLDQGGLGRFQKIELHPDGNMNVLKPQFKENQDMHVAFGETTAKELEFTSENDTLLHRSNGTTDKSQVNFFRDRDFDPRIRDTPSKGKPSFDEAEALAKSIRKACGQKRLEIRDNDAPISAEKTAADKATRTHLRNDVAAFSDLPPLQRPYHDALDQLKEALSPEDPKLTSSIEACETSDTNHRHLEEKLDQHGKHYANLHKEAASDDTDLETLSDHVRQHEQEHNSLALDVERFNGEAQELQQLIEAALSEAKNEKAAALKEALNEGKTSLNKEINGATVNDTEPSDFEQTWQILNDLTGEETHHELMRQVENLRSKEIALHDSSATLQKQQATLSERVDAAETQEEVREVKESNDALGIEIQQHNQDVKEFDASALQLNEDLKSAVNDLNQEKETALAEALNLTKTNLDNAISGATPNGPTDTEFSAIYQALINLGDENAGNTFGEQVEALKAQQAVLSEAQLSLTRRQGELTNEISEAKDNSQVESVGLRASALLEEIGEHNTAVKDFDAKSNALTTKLEAWWEDLQSQQAIAQEEAIAQAEALSKTKEALHVDKASLHKIPPSGYEAAFKELQESGASTDLGEQVEALNAQKTKLITALTSTEASADDLTQKIDDATDQDSLNKLHGEVEQWKKGAVAHNTAVKKFLQDADNLTQAIRNTIPTDSLEGLSAKLKLARLCSPQLTQGETAQLQGLLNQSPSELSPEECEQGLAYLEILSRNQGPEGQLSETQLSWLYEHHQNNPQDLENNPLFGDIVTQVSKNPQSPPAFSTLLGFVSTQGENKARTYSEASKAFKALYEPALDGPPKKWDDQKLSSAMKKVSTKPRNTAALTDALELMVQPRGHYNHVTAASYGKTSPHLRFSDFADHIEKKTDTINAKPNPSESEKYFLQLARLFQQKMGQNSRGDSSPWNPTNNDFRSGGAKLQFFPSLPTEGRNPFELLLDHISDSSAIVPPSLETSTLISIPDATSPNKSLEINSSSDLEEVLSNNKAMGLQLRNALPPDFGNISPTEIMNTIISTNSTSIKLSPQQKITLLSDYVYPWLATDIQAQNLVSQPDITRFSSPGSSNDFRKLVGEDPEFALEILKFMKEEKVVFNAAQMQALKAMHKSKVQRVTTKIHMGAGEGKTYLAKVYAALVNTERLSVLTHGGPTFHLAPFEQQEDGWKTIRDEDIPGLSTEDLVDLMSLEKDLAVTAKGMHKILDRFTPPSVHELPDFLQNSQYFIDEYDNDEYITDHGNLIARLRARGAKSEVHMSATRNDKEVLRRLEIKRKTLGQLFNLTPEEVLLPRKELEDLTTSRKSTLSPKQLIKVDTLFEQITSLEGTIAENSRDNVLNKRLKNTQIETLAPRDSAVETLQLVSQNALKTAGSGPGNILLELPDISIATSPSTYTLTTDDFKQALTPQLATLDGATTLLIRVPGGELRQFDFSPPSQWSEGVYNPSNVKSKRTICLYHKDSVGGDFNAFSASNCLSHTIVYEKQRSANELYQNLRRYRGNDTPNTTVLVSQSLGDDIKSRSEGTSMGAKTEALRSMANERNEELFLQAEYADSKDKIGRKCSKIIQTEAGATLNAVRKNVKDLKPCVDRLQDWLEDRWALNFKSLTPQDKVLLKNICDETNCYPPGEERSINWLINAKNFYDSPDIRIDEESPWELIKLALEPIDMMVADFDNIIDENTDRISSMVTDEMVIQALNSDDPQAHMDTVIQRAIDSTLESVPDPLARSLVKSISQSAPGRLKRDDYHRTKLDYYIHKHSLYKEQLANRELSRSGESAPVSTIQSTATPQKKKTGDSVASAAESLKGKLKWTLPAMNEKGRANDFEEFVKRGKELGENSEINCWEAVLFSAIKADVLKPDVVRAAFRDNMAVDFSYNKQIEDWLADPSALTPYPGDTEPQPGDIITFFGMSHVALSLGGDRVMSLWNQPNDDHTFQETTIGELTRHVEEDEDLLIASLNTAIGTYTGDADADTMYDAVNDYKDLRNDEDSTAEEVAEAKAYMLDTVGSALGVQILSSPWERLEQLAQQRKEY